MNDNELVDDLQHNNHIDEDTKLSEARAETLNNTYIESQLPKGFSFDKDNWLTYQVDDDENSLPTRICSRLEIVARTRDQANENHGRLLQFFDPDGVVHQWPMPMDLLAGDGTLYRQELLSMGLLIAPGKNARQLLTTYIQISTPNRTVRCAKQTGWNKDRTAFVLQNGTVGHCGNEPLILQTSFTTATTQGYAGEVKDWQQLSSLCIDNSRLIFAVSMAFAPPLLRLTGMESGGVHFRGQSSTGKSTCLSAASSVWGGGDYIQQWRATANGLEGTAVLHNDGLLCLDEMAQMDPNEIGKAAYMLANQVGKIRSNTFGNSRRPATWTLLFLSSGEISLADHMHEAKQRSKAGQEIRVLDIPADGMAYGCFENLHGYEKGKLFAEKITELSKTYYGTAGKEFVKQLLTDQGTLTRKIKKSIEDLSNKWLPPTASGQVHRAFNRFALIAIAGELTTHYGITGWPEGTATKAVSDCFTAWLRSRGDLGPQEEHQILSHVKHFFEQHGESRFSPWREEDSTTTKTILRAGFRKTTDAGEEFLMFRETFKKDLCLGFDPTFVAQVCMKHGLLMPSPNGTSTRSERLPGSKKNTRVFRFTHKVLSDDE